MAWQSSHVLGNGMEERLLKLHHLGCGQLGTSELV